MENRRGFERFGSDMIFWLKTAGSEDMHPFMVENISAGGILISSEQELSQDQVITLEFELPQFTDLIHAEATVVHVKKEGDRFKMGVEFAVMNELSASDLVGYLEEIFK